MPSYNELPFANSLNLRLETIKAAATGSKMTYTFTQDYALALVFCSQVDSDNNGDNFQKVYSVDKGDYAAATHKTLADDEWPSLYIKGDPAVAATAFTDSRDQNSLAMQRHSTSALYGFTRVHYKADVKQGDTIYLYHSHGAVFWIMGVSSILNIKEFGTTFTGIAPHKIRYIQDRIGGSNKNTTSHWVKIQVFDTNGVNIAPNGTASSIPGGNTPTFSGNGSWTSLLSASAPVTADYLGQGPDSTGLLVDLGGIYDVDHIVVFHYWSDSRTYYGHSVLVSEDGNTWYEVTSPGAYTETSSGKTITW